MYNSSTDGGEVRPDVGPRLDRELRARRAWVEVRKVAGRRVQRGVRRRDKDQASLNLIYLLGFHPTRALQGFGESDERFHIAGGNWKLPEAKALPARTGYRP